MTNSSSVVLERTMNKETVCLLNIAVSVLIDKGQNTTLIISEHERVGKSRLHHSSEESGKEAGNCNAGISRKTVKLLNKA